MVAHLWLDSEKSTSIAAASITYTAGFDSDPEPFAGFVHLCEHLLGERLHIPGRHGGQYDAGASGVFLSAKTYADSTQFTVMSTPDRIDESLAAILDVHAADPSNTALEHALRIVELEAEESRFRRAGQREQWVEVRHARSSSWSRRHDGFGYDLDAIRTLELWEITMLMRQRFTPDNRFVAKSDGEFRPWRPPTPSVRGAPMRWPFPMATMFSAAGSAVVEVDVPGLSCGLPSYVACLVVAELLRRTPELSAVGRKHDVGIGHFGPWNSRTIDQLVLAIVGIGNESEAIDTLTFAIHAVAGRLTAAGIREALERVRADYLERVETPVQRVALAGQLLAAGILEEGDSLSGVMKRVPARALSTDEVLTVLDRIAGAIELNLTDARSAS
ncbi:hypothetical protein [Rathayibacter iranicus]|uniref:Peptidase M16 N-terminal domain-containing protein n=2 Tax=Rathayibacter iranicus TaxID=59737 RepID=A0AAD1AGJ7_9MICO|nr:hypothetical protein [Rathayibacter iranicus]AZZ56860.1 hypothetical protein C7V51_14005 [Rathayibacter iranicus]MWV32049.1 hypothetical protein [Rathayibacter iranicus NCPPB 2253 = VKM Ac-1602]PPI42539.1 hypothetical protein C5E09_12860 [Rathayibacter iranicus]PPI58001.1 hypothetical protein C5E08_13765 [Rathayibacter iranicus]PPI68912.1 hypothetical protein C5E01_12815 [Rathayibacter iranicus]